MINGKFNVIDAHCHIYPEKIASRAVAGTDAFYGGGLSLHKGTVSDLLKIGEKCGIDHFIVQSVATSPKQVGSINEFIAESVNQGGGKLTGLGTLHPDSENQEAEVKRIKELGLKGVKLHPDIQQFKIDDYRCLKIYEICEREKLPILMHTGDSRFDYSNPNRLLPILEIYEDLIIVGAHMGAWSLWDEAAEKLSGFKNLYVDCSSSLAYEGRMNHPNSDLEYLTTEHAKEIINKFGIDHVLFGSDYPMWAPQKDIEALLKMNFSDEEYRKVFYENAKRIFID